MLFILIALIDSALVAVISYYCLRLARSSGKHLWKLGLSVVLNLAALLVVTLATEYITWNVLWGMYGLFWGATGYFIGVHFSGRELDKQLRTLVTR